MTCQVVFVVLLTVLVICSAHDSNWNPAAEDHRIQKQPPHHWGTPAPDSDLKLDFVPFRMLASVRHEKTSKHHVPRSEVLSTASTPAEVILAKRLRESITTHKIGEVYTEQGYEDQKHDHGYYEKEGKFFEKFEINDQGKVVAKKPHQVGDASTTVPKYYPKQVAQSSNIKEIGDKPSKFQYDTKKYPFYEKASKDSPIRYAINPDLIPDKNNGETPFYDSTNYKECPEITPEIKIGPDVKHEAGEPRLKGLGDKIDCLKSKYFGEDPFDNPFFKEDEVELETNAPTTLLPSESQNGPVLQLINVTKSEIKPKVKKVLSNINNKPVALAAPAASTEYVEGLLPPPLPIRRLKRGIEVLTSRRGGVRFSDLQSDGSDIDTAKIVSAHRVTANNRFGVREGESRRAPETRSRSESSRGRARTYEVTEEPEESPATSSRFTHRNSPSRRVQVEHHRATQEDVYSSTYVPASEDVGEVMTTTVWNAVPEPEAFTPRSSFEQQAEPQHVDAITDAPRVPAVGRARPRARPSVAGIREDVFEARGEKRKVETSEKSNSDLLRSRSRVRVKPVDNARSKPTPPPVVPVTQEAQDAFIIPTENIPSPTESYEIPAERENTGEKSIRQRPKSNDGFEIPTEKIPEARPQRVSISERRPRPPVIPNAIPIPIEEVAGIATAVPPSRRSQEGSSGISPRSKSGRLEAIRGRKQDYTARIPSEPSRHTARQRTEENNTPQAAVEAPAPRLSSRPRSRVAPIDPVQSIAPESPSDTRRVHRQGARGGRPRNQEPVIDEQRVDVAPAAPSRRTTSRRNQQSLPQPEAAASSSATSTTRYQFPELQGQATTLYQDASGKRYLCIVLDDDVAVDKVVVNTS